MIATSPARDPKPIEPTTDRCLDYSRAPPVTSFAAAARAPIWTAPRRYSGPARAEAGRDCAAVAPQPAPIAARVASRWSDADRRAAARRAGEHRVDDHHAGSRRCGGRHGGGESGHPVGGCHRGANGRRVGCHRESCGGGGGDCRANPATAPTAPAMRARNSRSSTSRSSDCSNFQARHRAPRDRPARSS